MLDATDRARLRDCLLRQRRTRLGRNGSLGPVVKALHDLAALLELDRDATNGRGQGCTDILVIMRACYGPLMFRDHRRGHYRCAPLRTHRKARTSAWALTDAVVAVLGSEYGATAADVRATADRLAAEAISATAR